MAKSSLAAHVINRQQVQLRRRSAVYRTNSLPNSKTNKYRVDERPMTPGINASKMPPENKISRPFSGVVVGGGM
jgi:hypothetical protein